MAEIQKLSYSHEAMLNLIIAKPGIAQKELAAVFGRTPGWISQILNSDAFRERMAERQEEVVDPVLKMTLEERIKGMADTSLQIMLDKLEAIRDLPPTIGTAVVLKAFEQSTRALGYGARVNQPQVTVQTYVAVVPVKSLDSAAWTEAHSPLPLVERREALPFVDVEVRSAGGQ